MACGGRSKQDRGKQPAQAAPQNGKDVMRDTNWFEPETTRFLTVARAVQVETGRTDTKFKDPEWHSIHEQFHYRLPTYTPPNTRTVEQLKNKMKSLRGEFSTVMSLICRSGWGWNTVTHQVMAPNNQAWEELKVINKTKYGPWKRKVWPYLELFQSLVGCSIPTGDHTDWSRVGARSGSGSSDNPPDPYDEPVHDSSERERFDFQEMANAVLDETVQGVPVDQTGGVPGVIPGGDAGPSARTSGSNKRKSSEATEGSRTKRAKKSIRDKNARAEATIAALGQMVESQQQIVQQNEELIALQKAKMDLNKQQMDLNKQQMESVMMLNSAKTQSVNDMNRQAQVPIEIITVLKGFGLNMEQRTTVLRTLNTPDERLMFATATEYEQRSRLIEIISGLLAGWNAAPAPGGHQSYFPNFFPNPNNFNR